MPNEEAAVEGLPRTLTCVLVCPCTGVTVAVGVDGIGVRVADGTTVGANVAVIMNGVEVFAAGSDVRRPHPVRATARIDRSATCLCTD